MFGAAFSGTTYLAFPPQGLSLRWFENALSNTAFRASFATSMQVAFGGTGLALLFGVPAAYAMSRYRVQLPKALGVMFILPILIPEIVAGFSLLRFLQVGLGFPLSRRCCWATRCWCCPIRCG